MFNPNAHCKLARFHRKPAQLQHRKRVAAAVPDRQYEIARLRFSYLARLHIAQKHGIQFPVPYTYIVQAGMKEHFAAVPFDILSDIDHYFAQFVAADMRFIQIYDLCGSAKLRKISSTSLFSGLFVCVFSFPSENVPAPPSPNCTLQSAFNILFSKKLRLDTTRSSTFPPRSITVGRIPARIRRIAQNNPAGPLPTTIARRG